MADIRELTLKIKLDAEGLKDLSTAVKKTSSELYKQNRVEGSIRKSGRLRSVVQEASAKRLN